MRQPHDLTTITRNAGPRLPCRHYAEPSAVVDAYWLCTAVLRAGSVPCREQKRRDARREAAAILQCLGMGETRLAEAWSDLAVASRKLRVAPLRGHDGASALLLKSLWPTFRHLLALPLSWDNLLEGSPVLRTSRRKGVPNRAEFQAAVEVTIEASWAAESAAQALSPILVGAWGGKPGRTCTLAEVIAADPSLARGCLYFVDVAHA